MSRRHGNLLAAKLVCCAIGTIALKGLRAWAAHHMANPPTVSWLAWWWFVLAVYTTS